MFANTVDLFHVIGSGTIAFFGFRPIAHVQTTNFVALVDADLVNFV
jgi:hypothetical protein